MTILSKTARIAVITCLIFLCTSNVWAVPYEIEIQNGVWSGFSATQIHDKAAPPFGAAIYNPLVGTLSGNFTFLGGGGFELSGIMGELVDSSGVNAGSIVRILDGLITDGAETYANGYFKYKIIGGSLSNTIGTFTFEWTVSRNFLTNTTLQLWGGDGDHDIGFDLRAELSPGRAIPEPATILLFVTGVIGIIIWRISRRGVGIA